MSYSERSGRYVLLPFAEEEELAGPMLRYYGDLDKPSESDIS